MALNDNNPPNYQDILDHEGSMYLKGAQRNADQRTGRDLPTIKPVHKWSAQYIDEVVKVMEREAHEASRRQGPIPQWAQVINEMHVPSIAYATFMTCVDGSDKNWTMNDLYYNVGRGVGCLAFEAVLWDYNAGEKLVKRLTQSAHHANDSVERRRDYVMRFARERGFSWDRWFGNEEEFCAVIGAAMVSCLCKALPQVFEIAYLQLDPESRYPSKYLVLTAQAEAEIEESIGEFDALSPIFGPMNSKPLPWSLDQIGPYVTPSLAIMTPMVKRATPDQKQFIREGMEDGSFDNATTALNSLQEVPYTVNQYIVDAVEWVRKRGLSSKVTKFPNTSTVPVPKMPKAEYDALPSEQRREFQRERRKIKAANRQARGNRSKLVRTIKEAKELGETGRYFLPHNWDRRGRIYHVPDFGHHNTDHMRGLLLFANKTEIGPDGVKWLMLQLANTYGNKVDKRSIEGRLEWVRENEEAILAAGSFDTIDNDGFKAKFDFWREADEPFQFLAACHELAQAMTYGESYKSGLPIALDATQSGIQHYAAASLNRPDGELVNLVPQDTPRDLYDACLAVAKQMVEDDLAQKREDEQLNPVNDNEAQTTAEYEKLVNDEDVDFAEKKRAKRAYQRTTAHAKQKRASDIRCAEQWLTYGLKRKHLKRNTMTWAYSSKAFGMGKQLQSDEMEPLAQEVRLGIRDQHPFQPDDGHAAAVYLGGINYEAIRRVVQSAAAGMDFFQKCAAALAEHNLHLKFTTPKIGFPMQQYYRVETNGRRKILGYDAEMNLTRPGSLMSFRKYTDQVNRRESVQAIAPNIIHAMDSTHLMLVVLYCLDREVDDLMVVHDSFATTVGNAQRMSLAIREAFVDLYDGYCLYSDLLEQVKAQHPDPDSVDWPEIPPKGDLDLAQIINSDYCFS